MRIKIIVFFHLLIVTAYSQNKSDHPNINHIKEEGFIRINGIDQWVTIKGDKTKPVVLFLHGGPGSPISPYADTIYKTWEKDFILVQWDQRGTGKTFGHNRPGDLSPEYLKSNPLTIEQMTTDGIELVNFLVKHLGKQKIILFGTSWGSILGVKIAIKNPELFYAYIGHSQMVNPSAALGYVYQKVFHLAQNAKDQKTIDVLNSIGKPPYDTAKNLGQLLRVVKKYQQKNSIPAPAYWFELSPEYNSDTDNQNRSDGDDYSFINYAGDQRFGITPMSSSVNFLNDGFIFKIPVYLIQGEEDIQTPEVLTKEYFTKISAPKKKFMLLPKTDHGFNQSVVDMHYKIMTLFIKPLIKSN
jgi:pimeloyl-ACP methyl ester carboxylesterase